jgi:hypothetical protein
MMDNFSEISDFRTIESWRYNGFSFEQVQYGEPKTLELRLIILMLVSIFKMELLEQFSFERVEVVVWYNLRRLSVRNRNSSCKRFCRERRKYLLAFWAPSNVSNENKLSGGSFISRMTCQLLCHLFSSFFSFSWCFESVFTLSWIYWKRLWSLISKSKGCLFSVPSFLFQRHFRATDSSSRSRYYCMSGKL